MKIIEKLSEMIDEEIHDAKKYAKCALHYKSEMPDLADLFFRLSGEETEHMKALHEKAAEIIKDYREKKGEPPAEMLAVYNYLHKKQIEHAAEVKRLREMYRE